MNSLKIRGSMPQPNFTNSIPQNSKLSTDFEKNSDAKYNLDTTNTTKPKVKTKAEVVAENKELRAENRALKKNKNQMCGMLEKLNRERAEYCHTKTKNPSH